MGFLKRFYRNVLNTRAFNSEAAESDHISTMEFESHLTVCRYGNFELTEAVRPSMDLQIVPEQGYRHDVYRDNVSKRTFPVLLASISRERLFDTFLDLLDPIGDVVDVVIETSHTRKSDGHLDFCREEIDLPVLKSYLYDFEELIMNDGCFGIAVLNPSIPLEIQFDEHKTLIAYSQNLSIFQSILERNGIFCCESLRFLTEAEHIHTTRMEFVQDFRRLQTTLGIA
ncbi:MAG: hypothetical protein ACRCUY_05215 [Thermoguttaceae bacterium]